MWIVLTVISAVLLGVYDVAKKQSLKRNGVLEVLLATTLMSTALMSPFCKGGTAEEFSLIAVKSALVTASWVSGLAAMRLLPLTTISTLKASRPVFVLSFSLILFGERLSPLQWVGVAVAFGALWMLTRASSREGIILTRSRGMAYMLVSIFAGVASALMDKVVVRQMEPTFAQFWANAFISLYLLLCIVVRRAVRPGTAQPFRWDWTLVLISVLITGADASYFFALSDRDALLSVVSLTRRVSVVVTFAISAVIFKEKEIGRKGAALAVLLCGITILCISSI